VKITVFLAQSEPIGSQVLKGYLFLKVENSTMQKLWYLLVACCLGLAAVSVLGQDVQTKGMIGGTVTDATGAAVPGAKIVITGQTGERNGTTNDSGIFRIENLERR
jgi:hypothetical protein